MPLIKINNDNKLDKYCVKIKLRRYPMSAKSDLYEYTMNFFDNGNMLLGHMTKLMVSAGKR